MDNSHTISTIGLSLALAMLLVILLNSIAQKRLPKSYFRWFNWVVWLVLISNVAFGMWALHYFKSKQKEDAAQSVHEGSSAQKEEEGFDAMNRRKLKTLHSALITYMEEHNGVWPQVVQDDVMTNRAYFHAWQQVFAGSKITADDLTPSGSSLVSGDPDLIFVFTSFDSTKNSAYVHDTPWIIMSGEKPRISQLMVRRSGNVELAQADAPKKADTQ